MYGRWLTAQQKDERRQDNGDEKRLACHHPSDLLSSLTLEWIGGGQYGVVSPALRALPVRTLHVLSYISVIHLSEPTTDLARRMLTCHRPALGCSLVVPVSCVESTERGATALLFQGEPQRSERYSPQLNPELGMRVHRRPLSCKQRVGDTRQRFPVLAGRRLECFIHLVWLYAVWWVLVPSSWQVQDARSALRSLISLANFP